MAEKKHPSDHNPEQTPPGANPHPESDDSILDFGITQSVRDGASGVVPLADLPDPQSNPSLVSWTEVIRHHRETTPTANTDQPVRIDSTSDKDLLERIAQEEQHDVPFASIQPAERDTDKLGTVPLVRRESGSSIHLGRQDGGDPQEPRSGSSVRFDVKAPPPDAAGAMPSPWADAMIAEAVPVSDDKMDAGVPMAEAIPHEGADDQLNFAAVAGGSSASGSVVKLYGKNEDDDIMEAPLADEGTPTGRSSILDILVNEDKLEDSGANRAPSDLLDVASDTAGKGSKGAPTGDDSVPAMDLESGNPEEAVDLYAEGPVSRGITDSGSLQVTDDEMEEASRRHQAADSSAIDLSSHPSGSMFDIDSESARHSDNIDMGLPEDHDPVAQSSMVRRDSLSDDEERLAAKMGTKKSAPSSLTDAEIKLPSGRKGRAADPSMPARGRVYNSDTPTDESEVPQSVSRARGAKAEPPKKKGGGLLLGMIIGVFVAAGGAGAAWYLKKLPDPDSVFGDGAAKTNTGGNDADFAKAKKDADDAKKAADDMVKGLRDQLAAAGIDAEKADDGLKKALADKTVAEGQVKNASDALKKAGIMDGNLAAGIATLVTANDDARKEITAVSDKVKPKKDQKVSDAIQAIIAAKEKAETDQRQAELNVANAVKQLKDAGFDDAKLEESIKKAVAGKTEADTKIKAALVALEKAGVKDADLAKALTTLIAAKDGSDASLKGVRERLEKAKIIAANADQTAVIKGIDDVITRGSSDAITKLAAEKKAFEDRAAKLDGDLKTAKKEAEAIALKAADDLSKQKTTYEAKLADVRTPAHLIDVWLPALAEKEKGANAVAAIADADVVLKNAASSDADKAKALAVKALALRNQGKVTEARAAFDVARKHPGFAKDLQWAKEVATAAETLENPAAFVGATIAPPPTRQQLLDRVENGLKLFDGEKFAKDRARLVAQRSLLKLEANDLPGAFADASDAVKSGAGADAKFALARALEAQGKMAEAEAAYREVLKAQPEGTAIHKQASLGLARVLLQKSRPASAPTPMSMRDREGDLPARVVLALILLADGVGAIPADIQESLKLADALIAQKEFLGYIIKADALAKLGRFNDALTAYSTGIKLLQVLPREYDGVLDRILAQHAALQKPDPNLVPDQSRAEKHYAQGLEYYRDKHYMRAEEQFIAAIRNWNKDARYLYYLGLARWSSGKRSVAAEDFKAAALLEMKGMPLPKVVTVSFERIQGGPRAAVEAFRP